MILDPSYILPGLKSLSALISMVMVSLVVSNITCFIHCNDAIHNIVSDESRKPTEAELDKIKQIHNKNRIRIYQISIGTPLIFYTIRVLLNVFTDYNLDIPDMFILISIVLPIIFTYILTDDGSKIYEEDIERISIVSKGISDTIKDILIEIIKKGK